MIAMSATIKTIKLPTEIYRSISLIPVPLGASQNYAPVDVLSVEPVPNSPGKHTYTIRVGTTMRDGRVINKEVVFTV